MPTIFNGPRLQLRPVERDMIPQLTAWFSDYELLRLLAPGTVAPVNLVAEESWFESVCKDKTGFTYAIMLRPEVHGGESPRLIGTCHLIGYHGKNRSAVLGIAIGDPQLRGQGLGSEALELLLEFGFLELNLHRIELYVFEHNARARALYERFGFKLEGTMRQNLYREGRYWDTYLMSLLRPEYRPGAHWKLDWTSTQ